MRRPAFALAAAAAAARSSPRRRRAVACCSTTPRAPSPPCTVTFETPVALGPRQGLVGYGCIAPHPLKVKKGGEDALFFEEETNTVALFDGVGGWAEQGVDPGLYSRGLAELVSRKVAAATADGQRHPAQLARILDQAVMENNKIHVGTTTACMVTLGPCTDPNSGTLYGLNVGDSGFMVLRNSDGVVYRSKDQTGIGMRGRKRIAFPYQVGTDGHSAVSDGDQYTMEVIDDDIIVMGTDGLLDNVYDDDIAFLVNKVKDEGDFENDAEYMRAVARVITQFAYQTSLDPQADIPLRLKELELSPSDPPVYGGKPDDITVACYKVCV